MPQTSPRTALPGSEVPLAAGARVLGAAHPDERFEVTVRVRRRAELAPPAALAGNGKQRAHLSREQYAAAYGANPAELGKVEAFARHYGLIVLETSVARRSVFLSGTTAQFEAAFGVAIEQAEHKDGVSRVHSGALTVPAELAGIVEGVFGIADAPVALPHFRIHAASNGANGHGHGHAHAHAAGTSFTPPQLATLYDFPAPLDGSGQCIAIIELGGGYRTADINNYFKRIKVQAPTIKTISVDGAKNRPSNINSADPEVMLDIEVSAGVAPKALIAVYFAPNTDKGFLDAITMAIHDSVNKPSVISISWGAAEKNWSAQALRNFDQAFQSAAALGVSVCCAAGDAGSGDEDPDRGTPDGLAHADFPASSPYVLACGGTSLTASGAHIASETVWNNDPLRSASGGGVSDFFALPPYQQGAGVPPSVNPGARVGRGLPDVAADADPATGYQVRVDGRDIVVGGTSAVAPLWAGLIALMNQKAGHSMGFLNPMLYGIGADAQAFHDIVSGDIGAYQARPGWDACTGWGSPDGSGLLRALNG
ncbi:MAG: S53 family peptidase [Pseudomonadota bacterium]